MFIVQKDFRDITMDEITDYLKCDYEPETRREIEMFYAAAMSFIPTYLHRDWSYFEDNNGKLPADFTIAGLYLISHWFENRSVTGGKYISPKPVPFTITTILDLYREWL